MGSGLKFLEKSIHVSELSGPPDPGLKFESKSAPGVPSAGVFVFKHQSVFKKKRYAPKKKYCECECASGSVVMSTSFWCEGPGFESWAGH